MSYRLFAPALLTACLASCSEYNFAEQDVELRLDAAADQIHLNIDSRGLYALPRRFRQSSPTPVVEVARDRIRDMAKGQRYFHVLTWPLVFELDDSERPAADDEALASLPDDLPPALLAWIEHRDTVDASIHLESAAAYLDEFGEVSIRQTVRIENAEAMIAIANEMIGYAVRGGLENDQGRMILASGTGSLDAPFETQASRDNLLAFLDSGHVWFSLTEEEFVIYLPMIPEDLAAILRGSMSEAYQIAMADRAPSSSNQGTASLGMALAGGLQSMEFDGKVATLTFPVTESDGSPGRAIRWALRGPRNDHAKALAEAFDGGELTEGR